MSKLLQPPSVATDISVKDVCHHHWELFRGIRAVVFPPSGKYLHQGNIPNGVKVVQSLPSAAAA